MKRNSNMNTLAFDPATLLRTKVRRKSGGEVPAQRIIGFVETLPRAILAREFRETLAALTERFSPVTFDDGVLVQKLAALILEVSTCLPEDVVGRGDPNGPTERRRALESSVEGYPAAIAEFTEYIEGVAKAIETLKPGIDMSEWRRTNSPGANSTLTNVEEEIMAKKKEQEKANANQDPLRGKRMPFVDFTTTEAFNKARATFGLPLEMPEPITPAEDDTASLVIEETLARLTEEKAVEVIEIGVMKEEFAEDEEELRSLRSRPVEKEELTPAQTDSINKYRKARESEISQIESTLLERLTARRKNFSASSGAAAT